MYLRNLLILLINVALGLLWALEPQQSLLGRFLLQPYRDWTGPFLLFLVLFWTLLGALIMRRWAWSVGGILLSLGAFTAVTLIPDPTLILRSWPNLLAMAGLLVAATLFLAVPAAQAYSFRRYNSRLAEKPVVTPSAVGFLWLLFLVIAGYLAGMALYYRWLPAAFLPFLGSPESLRLALYISIAGLGGVLTLSPGWSGVSILLFVFEIEFLNNYLSTAYASISQLQGELAGIFVDPQRVVPMLFLIGTSLIWAIVTGYFARRSIALQIAGKRIEQLPPADARLAAERSLEQAPILDGTTPAVPGPAGPLSS